MNSYTGLHAKYFDIIYGSKPYVHEAVALHELFEAKGFPATAPVLELACGTGSHAFEFARLGHQVTAVDYCPDLLAIAHQKAQRFNADFPTIAGPEFLCQDVRDLDIPGRQYDAATCLFDSIGYFGEDDAVERALTRIAGFLRPNGLIVIEFLHRETFIAGFDKVRAREFRLPGGGKLLRTSEVTLFPGHSRFEVKYRVVELRGDGSYSSFEQVQNNRIFLPSQMQTLLTASGFTSIEFKRAYDMDSDLELCWHILAIARKA